MQQSSTHLATAKGTHPTCMRASTHTHTHTQADHMHHTAACTPPPPPHTCSGLSCPLYTRVFEEKEQK